jgi:hypothetical protein
VRGGEMQEWTAKCEWLKGSIALARVCRIEVPSKYLMKERISFAHSPYSKNISAELELYHPRSSLTKPFPLHSLMVTQIREDSKRKYQLSRLISSGDDKYNCTLKEILEF